MATISPPPISTTPSGRGLFWSGIGLCLAAVLLCLVQYGLGHLFLPWYLPVLITVGAALLLASLVQRRTWPRLVFLVLFAGLAGFAWFFIVMFSRLPEYTGPAQAGTMVPAFQTVRADGQPFSDRDLKDGTPTVLVFFRGRW